MKRRWISLLAIVALLISMMTCVVIPSTAADTTGSEATSGNVTPTLKQIARDFYDTINWSGNDALLATFRELYSGNADAGIAVDYEKAIKLVDDGLAGKDPDGNDLATPLTWKNFNGTSKPYPRFLCHEAYEARGYDGLNWTIAAKEDWYEMDDVAMTADPANSPYFDATGTKYFEGVTFHLKATVNFSSVDMMPLGAFRGRLFSGTIDGHGYGFSNVKIYVEKAEIQKAADYDVNGDGSVTSKDVVYSEFASTTPVAGGWSTGTYDVSIGLIGFLGSCTIKNFGIDSGCITAVAARKSVSVSTFGDVPAGATTAENPLVFENIWSSAWVFSNNDAYVSALFGTDGIVVYDVYAKVNGAVLDGAYLSKSGGGNYPGIYMVGGLFTPAATGNEFSNIILSGDAAFVQNTISDNKTSVEDLVVVAAPETKWLTNGMFILDAEASFDANNFKNVYGITGAHKMTNGYLVGVGTGIKKGANADSLMVNMTEGELAYALNQTPTEENPVYFTVKDGKIRPTSNAAEKLVRVTVNTGDTQRVVYAAPNSTVNLKEELGYTSEITLTSANDCEIQEDGVSVKVGAVDAAVALDTNCDHAGMEYVTDAENNRHTASCALCGHKVDEACKATQYTTIADETWKTATHTAKCGDCSNEFTEKCELVYTKVDGGYKYVCRDCGSINDAPALMVLGDADENGKVNLIDAIQVLKVKAGIEGVTIDERNADTNGNNVVELVDVPKIIKRALGDKNIEAEFEPLEERVNKANYYDASKVTIGNLTMAGAEDANKRFLRTELISVVAGDKVVFGPVRKTQAVLGHFYGADGENSVELININNENLDIEYAFKATVTEKANGVINDNKVTEGMVMVSITVPEGAEYVRFQLTSAEKDRFYVRINNDFTVADYQYCANGNANNLENPLKNQLFLVIGDSLCSAANDNTTDPLTMKGWKGRIVRNFGANVINSSQGGSAISTVSLDGEIDDDLLTGETATDRQWIVSQLQEHKGNYKFEYILLEGGGNDAAYDAPLGRISPVDNFDPANFDSTSTFAGGMERLIYNAIQEHGDTAAIGYMTIYSAPHYLKNGVNRFGDMEAYFNIAREICAKWKIPCLDLNTILTADIFDARIKYDPEVDTEPSDYATNPQRYAKDANTMDGIHAIGTGYDIMQRYIDPFVYGTEDEVNYNAIMKPVDQEIYLEVQRIEANKAATN